jgi:hypothetical protein
MVFFFLLVEAVNEGLGLPLRKMVKERFYMTGSQGGVYSLANAFFKACIFIPPIPDHYRKEKRDRLGTTSSLLYRLWLHKMDYRIERDCYPKDRTGYIIDAISIAFCCTTD